MLESERLVFRELKLDDAEALFDMYSDAVAMKYRANPPLTTLEEAIQMVNNSKKSEGSSASFRLGIINKESNILMGTLLLVPLGSKGYKVGFSFGKPYWNKGYGFEVLKAVIAYLRQRNVTLVKAIIHLENKASIKIVERMGFKQTTSNLVEKLHHYEREL